MGDTIPEQVGMSYIRKIAEEARGSKPVSSVPLWSLLQDSTLAFLDDGLYVTCKMK